MRVAHRPVALAVGLLLGGAVARPAAAQQPQVKRPEITVYKIPT